MTQKEERPVESPRIFGPIILPSICCNITINNIKYVKEIEVDANNLTRSGYITPAVDFQHLQEVLVITSTKEQLLAE